MTDMVAAFDRGASPAVLDTTALWGARAALWQWHVGANLFDMGPLWFAMTGYTREQWDSVPDPWLSRLHPHDRVEVEQQLRDHLDGRRPAIDVEYRIRAGNGIWKWMLTRGRAVSWDLDGKATLATGVSLDIHARKVGEAQTGWLQGQFQQALSQDFSGWLALVDRQRRVTFLNRPLLGCDPESLAGRMVEELVIADERPVLHSELEHVMYTGESRTYLQRSAEEKASGGVQLEWHIHPLRTGEQITGAAIHIEDTGQRDALRADHEREMVETTNREQQRLGADLHDSLGQDLTGIALLLRSITTQLSVSGPRQADELESVIGLVNRAIETTRNVARGLSPISAETGGLAAALNALTQSWSERFSIPVQLTNEWGEAAAHLNDESATHVLRIVQEALTNVARHSSASHVAVTLGTSDVGVGLQCVIEDNGRGFDILLARESEGLGLKIMRYRARMLGGSLELESTPTRGTTVRCSIPRS